MKLQSEQCIRKTRISTLKSYMKQVQNLYRTIFVDRIEKSEFVERFPELSLFYRLFSPLDSEMICIFPYFCPYAESAREIREIFS